MPGRWISTVGGEWGEEGLRDRGQRGGLVDVSKQERRKNVRLDCLCMKERKTRAGGLAVGVLFQSLFVVTGHEVSHQDDPVFPTAHHLWLCSPHPIFPFPDTSCPNLSTPLGIFWLAWIDLETCLLAIMSFHSFILLLFLFFKKTK